VKVGLLWAAIDCIVAVSKPGAQALVAMPAKVIRMARPTKTASTCKANATSAARLVIVMIRSQRREDRKGRRDHLERAGNLPSDLAVQRDVHRQWSPDRELGHRHDAEAVNPSMKADGGIER